MVTSPITLYTVTVYKRGKYLFCFTCGSERFTRVFVNKFTRDEKVNKGKSTPVEERYSVQTMS